MSKSIESWVLQRTDVEDLDLKRKTGELHLFWDIVNCLKGEGIVVHPGHIGVDERYRAFNNDEIVMFSRDDGSEFADGHGDVFIRANSVLARAKMRVTFVKNGLSLHETSPGLFLADPRDRHFK